MHPDYRSRSVPRKPPLDIAGRKKSEGGRITEVLEQGRGEEDRRRNAAGER